MFIETCIINLQVLVHIYSIQDNFKYIYLHIMFLFQIILCTGSMDMAKVLIVAVTFLLQAAIIATLVMFFLTFFVISVLFIIIFTILIDNMT